jgi:hypothetical protein
VFPSDICDEWPTIDPYRSLCSMSTFDVHVRCPHPLEQFAAGNYERPFRVPLAEGMLDEAPLLARISAGLLAD